MVIENGKPVATVISRKFAYFLEQLMPFLRETLSHNLVMHSFSDALKLEAEMSEFLLEKLSVGNAMANCLVLTTPGLSATYFSDPQIQER